MTGVLNDYHDEVHAGGADHICGGDLGDEEQIRRAEKNRGVRQQRVFNLDEEYKGAEDFEHVAFRGGTVKPPVALRTPGRGVIRGKTLVDRSVYDGCHLIQAAYIEPGDRKYLHHHLQVETIWVILEGEGEFYGGPELEDIYPIKAGDVAHALPGQWHGMGNLGTTRLRYLSIEGPMPYGGAFDMSCVAEPEE